MHQLRSLAESYFHQDHDLEAATPLDILTLFREAESEAAVTELTADVKSQLDSPMTDSEMRRG